LLALAPHIDYITFSLICLPNFCFFAALAFTYRNTIDYDAVSKRVASLTTENIGWNNNGTHIVAQSTEVI